MFLATLESGVMRDLGRGAGVSEMWRIDFNEGCTVLEVDVIARAERSMVLSGSSVLEGRVFRSFARSWFTDDGASSEVLEEAVIGDESEG